MAKSARVYWCAKDQVYHFKFKNDQGKWVSKSTGKNDIVAALDRKNEFVCSVKAARWIRTREIGSCSRPASAGWSIARAWIRR
jgi:hypothetical protein